MCWLSPALKSSLHIPPAFWSKPARRDSAYSLVAAAFCPDPKALRAEVRDAEAAFKILQVLMEQGLLSTVWGAACVPSGGPLDPPHLQSGSGGSGNAHVSTSPFPCNPPQRVSVPHNWVSLILRFQSDTYGFQLFCCEFHLPDKLFACKAGPKSAFGSFPLQTFAEVAEC